MSTNNEMVNTLKSSGAIRSLAVENAFRKIDRSFFVNERNKEDAYFDIALPTSCGQTISAPGVVAIMLEYLDARKGMHILDVGSGSGYNVALLSELVGDSGLIITIERYAELSNVAKQNIEKIGGKRNIVYEIGDGSQGCEKHAPYDRIIITAAMPWFDQTHPLEKQLKEDGKLIAPIGEKYFQKLTLYDKKTKSLLEVLDVMFVPLIGKYGFD
ncbi:MAG: protein-L-isoaspartate(D-aspartate) O-methyltransferase [Candidatus Micrarchaeota archaeon]